MTIKNLDKFIAGLWDWAILDGCFGNTQISPTDFDGFVERHGKCLILEAKSPGVSIPVGQMRAFKTLIGTGIFTIIIVWGEKNKPQEIQVMTRRGIMD